MGRRRVPGNRGSRPRQPCGQRRRPHGHGTSTTEKSRSDTDVFGFRTRIGDAVVHGGIAEGGEKKRRRDEIVVKSSLYARTLIILIGQGSCVKSTFGTATTYFTKFTCSVVTMIATTDNKNSRFSPSSFPFLYPTYTT